MSDHKSKGIRIYDREQGLIFPSLPSILEEVQNGGEYYWSILYLYARGRLGKNISVPEFEKKIISLEQGFLLDWKELNELANKFEEIIDITILGCKNVESIHRYQTDKEMYEAVDICIEFLDSGFWEVFSKENGLINRLAKKFHNIRFLSTNYQHEPDEKKEE